MSSQPPDNSQRQTRFINYPDAIEGPKTAYKTVQGNNPVLSGLPLSIVASIIAFSGSAASFFWRNADLAALQTIPELINYEPRYDPTIILTGEDDSQSVAPDAGSVESKQLGHSTRISDYISAYKARQITPREVVEKILDIIEKDVRFKGTNSGRNATFLSVQREKVLSLADASTKRYEAGKPIGALDGVPLAIKDEVDLEGHPKTLATAMKFADPSTKTAWCVRKWEEAGGIIVGKLNMHEYGLDTTGNNPVTGTCTNPHNDQYYPGGSSSASATTVASNLLPLTLGCDGGGSIRIPSSYCGIYGLKTSHQRIGRKPDITIDFSSTVCGPMAGSMADLELGYRIMATSDPSDKANSLFAPPSIPPSLPSVSQKRRPLGICKPWFDAADPEVLTLCNDALAHYASAGYQIIDISLPYLREGQVAHALTITTEAGASVPASKIRSFTPANQILLSVFRQTPSHDFLLAQKMRSLQMSHLAFLFKQHPGLLIVTPTTPTAGWRIRNPADLSRGVSDGDMSLRSMTYAWMANFTGCPAISVPVGKAEGRDKGGKVPVGLMAMGEWGDEEGLIEWGRVAEEWVWRDKKMERPGIWVDVLARDRTT